MDSRKAWIQPKEITDYLGMRCSTISRVVNEDNKKTAK